MSNEDPALGSEAFDQAQRRLRAQLNEVHGISLGSKDPLAITLTALYLITAEVLTATRGAQDEALRDHRSELEQLTARWSRDAQQIGDRILWRVAESCRAEAAEAAHAACRSAEVDVTDALQEQMRSVARLNAILIAVVVAAMVLSIVLR